jgi:hypothetical protein
MDWGDEIAEVETPDDGRVEDDSEGDEDLGGGGLNACMGRKTVCTTWGLSLTALVVGGVVAASSVV